jgi:hypothetical protein
VLGEHGPAIAGEVLAVSFAPGDGPGGTGGSDGASEAAHGAGGGTGVAGPWYEHADADLGLRFWLAVAA